MTGLQKCFKYTHHWGDDPRLQINNGLTWASKPITKMSLALFHKVPVGAIETLFNKQNQPLFKWTDLGKYLVIKNIRDNFEEF